MVNPSIWKRHLAGTPERYEQMDARANLIGSILTGIALFLSVGRAALVIVG